MENDKKDDIDLIEVNKYIDELVKEGLSWNEIGEMCNNKYDVSYSESKWRKPYSMWRKTVDAIMHSGESIIAEDELARIARAKTRLDFNRQLIQQQRSLLNEETRNAGLVHIFNDTLQSVLEAKGNIGYIDPPKSETPPETSKKGINYVFVRSDGHYNGNQDLDLEFSEFYTIISDKKDEYNFDEIVIAELGDTIEGASLRPSQLLAVKRGMVEQAMVVSNYYIDFLNTVTADLNIKVKFLIVESSNHTQLRSLGTGRSELPMEDLMVLIAELIKAGTRNNPLVEIISAPIIVTEINGISYIFEHGHDAPKINNYLEKRESYYNKSFDFSYIGHFHHYFSKDIYEIKESMYNKNVTFVPHSCTIPGNFEKVKHLSSVPAIHFSIDSTEGKLRQENIVLKRSYKKMQDLEQRDINPKGRIIKLD